ncbi:MAG: thioredoxin domain-containing protein [archaeon]
MPIKINHNICDKGKGCPCITACPQKAWSFNEKTKRPEVDNSKCNDCFQCIKTCPARAVLGAINNEGLKKLDEEVSKYSKGDAEIKEPRFNADPSENESVITNKDFEEKINQKGIVLVEFWSENFASRCRLNAALYSDILPKMLKDVPVHKLNAREAPHLMDKFGVHTLPAILVFKDGKQIDHIAGYTSISEKEALKDRLSRVI